MLEQDRILVRLKLKSLGMSVKELASKIHTAPNRLDKILVGKDSSKLLEERIINWLEKKERI